MIGLGESGVAALERLLDHRAPDLFLLTALGNQRLHRFDDQIQRLLPAFVVALFRRSVAVIPRCLARHLWGLACGWPGCWPARGGTLFFAHQIVVEDELVAVRDQQIRSRVLDANPDDDLVVLAQLGDQRRKVRIAADNHECLDVRLRIAKIQRVDDHTYVGGVLARLPHVRDLDQLE